MNIKNILGTLAVAVGLVAASAPASALPTYTNGSFAFASGTSTTTDVTTTTSFVLPLPIIFATGAGGDFTGVVLPFATLLGVTSPLNFLTATGFNFSDVGIGSFSASSATLLSTVSGQNASATWDVSGSFTVGGAFANAGQVLTANETWSLTQTGGPGATISLSGTLNSPAQRVPEPATLTLLGLGLVAAGAMRKRGKAKA